MSYLTGFGWLMECQRSLDDAQYCEQINMLVEILGEVELKEEILKRGFESSAVAEDKASA
jgi:hypothetical protein